MKRLISAAMLAVLVLTAARDGASVAAARSPEIVGVAVDDPAQWSPSLSRAERARRAAVDDHVRRVILDVLRAQGRKGVPIQRRCDDLGLGAQHAGARSYILVDVPNAAGAPLRLRLYSVGNEKPLGDIRVARARLRAGVAELMNRNRWSTAHAPRAAC